MYQVNPKIDESWKNVLSAEFTKEYFYNLKNFLIKEQSKYTIFPKNSHIFSAYNNTKFDDVKVVILGQDPYHGANQAHGLAFSVQDGIKFPPSLNNIFKELEDDLGCSWPSSGNLTSWSMRGVFLLNTALTVREAEANSHQNMGWEYFTDATIQAISLHHTHVVFILWGANAKTKEKLIDTNKHLIIKSAHPSPLSSYRGFFGSKPFSKTNEYLRVHDKKEIEWCLNPQQTLQ